MNEEETSELLFNDKLKEKKLTLFTTEHFYYFHSFLSTCLA